MFRLCLWLKKVFLIRHLSSYKSMVVYQSPEKRLRSITTILLSKQFIIPAFTKQFRNKSIGMVGTQVFVPLLQRIHLIIMIEEPRYPQIFFILCDGIELVHGIIETAKFIADHLHARFLRKRLQFVISPVAHTFCHFQSRFIPTYRVLVDESLQDFMNGVERSPHTLALDVAVDKSLAKSREITRSILSLHFCQSLYQRVGFFPHLQISHRRKQMTGDVTAQVTVHRFPSCQFRHCHIAAFFRRKDTCRVSEGM